MPRSTISRRRFLKTTALAATSAVAAPYMRTSYAAGRLSLGLWDHFVPGASDTLKQICVEWGDKNHVEIQADIITTVGEKLQLTAAAEEQAKTGHDVYTLPRWQVAIHRDALEPVDDVMAALAKDYGEAGPANEYMAKHAGHWRAVPVAFGTQYLSCCSRLDLYKQHAGVDIARIFPPNDNRDAALTESWNWESYLASAEKLFKAGFPVGLPMGQTADSRNWVGALFQSFGAVMIDDKDKITVDSEATRAMLDYMKRLMPLNPPDVYAWDDTGNNKWLISGKGSGIMNPPSAWAVAKRDNREVAGQCWTHDMPKGRAGRFVASNPFFMGVWSFANNKEPGKDLLHHLSQRDQVRRMVNASGGYDLPPFKSLLDFDIWAKQEPPPGTLYNYPLRGDQETSIAGYPARPAIAAQIDALSLQPVMIAKVTQGGETIDAAIKWAERELEGLVRS